ncbi:MAG: DNA-3-methyladenine glycosylase [Acidimicrobiales bacterium]
MTTRPARGSDAGASPGALLPRSFYRRPSTELAPRLLNKVLVCGDRAVRIVEVEAYGGADDPASHAYRGQTPRNATMFGPPGLLYVYFTYGMHWCANAVCGEEGEAVAVLLRAGAPLRGLDAMRASRPAARREQDLANGPAKLCQALDIDRRHDGVDLAGPGSAVAIFDDGTPPPRRPGRSPRVGISVAVDRPWRWYVPGDPNVSRTRTRP